MVWCATCHATYQSEVAFKTSVNFLTRFEPKNLSSLIFINKLHIFFMLINSLSQSFKSSSSQFFFVKLPTIKNTNQKICVDVLENKLWVCTVQQVVLFQK